MALSSALTFTQNLNGITGRITDSTPDYGIGGNPLRGDSANYLLYSTNATNGQRTYYNISTSLPLSQLAWDVSTDIMGWTQATLLRIQIWSGANNYLEEQEDGNGIITEYASIVYYGNTDKVYKAIQDNVSIAPDDPGGDDYWEEVSDLTELVGYESVSQFTEDFQIDVNINKCVTKGFINIYNSCGCNPDNSKLEPAIKNWALYMAATANFQNEAPEKMDAIIEHLDKVCKTCS